MKNIILSAICYCIIIFTQCNKQDKRVKLTSDSEVPVIYSSDLWTPPGDPDDHFDLASLFSLKNLDIKAVILDNTMQDNMKRTGVEKKPNYEAVKKIAVLFNRDEVPAQAGLNEPLHSTADNGLNHPEGEQKAIELILKQLKSVEDSSAVFISTGSLRDICAAYNREPDLFQAKVKKLYVSLGDSYGTTGIKDTNVAKDIEAWKGIINSGLPVYWMPTNPSKGRGGISRYVSYWHFVQSELMLEVPERIRQFFISEGILVHAHSELPVRPMWSTPGIIEAAALNCYKINGELHWMPAHKAKEIPKAALMKPYEFVPIKFSVDKAGGITWEEVNQGETSSVRIFKINDYFLYNEAMFQFLLKQLNSL